MKNSFWFEPRSIVAIAGCLLALAEIIDLTIVGVALPSIMGALSCNIQEVALVTTSYIVSAAVCIMLTGYVSNRFGCRKVTLVSAVIFGVASVMCGFATSLNQMVLFRIIQGVGGAFLPSMAQGYISANFNDEERPKMMALLTLSMVLGPIIGPIMGGYLVQSMDWRWIFFVNVPVCVSAFLIVFFLMPESEKKDSKFDMLSFGFMALGFGALQYFIDEGNNNDWFDSRHMLIIFLISVISIIFFIWRGLSGKSVVNLKVFANLNFSLNCLYIFVFLAAASCIFAFYPTLMQNGYCFPPDLAGYITAPRGIFAIVGAGITLQLCKYFDKRYLLFFGLAMFIIASYLHSHFGTNWSLSSQIIAGAILGMSMSATFILLLQLAYTGLAHELSHDAAGIFNFFRNFGSSVGTSIASTLISRQQQSAWNDMASHLQPFSRGWQYFQQGMFAHLPLNEQVQLVAKLVAQQSFFVANIDIYYIAGISVLCLAWIPFFLDKPTAGAVSVSIH